MGNPTPMVAVQVQRCKPYGKVGNVLCVYVCVRFVNVATRTHVRDLYTGIARKSKSRRRIREKEWNDRGNARSGVGEGVRGGPRKSSRSNSISVRVPYVFRTCV